jgi:hypothetical protein
MLAKTGWGKSWYAQAVPEEREEVLVEAVALKLGHLLAERRPILEVSLRFWNRLVGEASRPRAPGA